MKSLVVFLSLFVLTTGFTVGTRPQHGAICDVCISTLEAVKSATTSDEIEKLVTDIATTVCSIVPGLHKDSCIKFMQDTISENFELIRTFTELFGPEDLCKAIKLCPQNEVVRSGDGAVCTICTDVLSVLRQILTDPTQKTMVKTYLETFCIATGPLKSMCLTVVDELAEEGFLFIQHIFSRFDDKQLCSQLLLCSKQSTTELIAYQEVFMRRSSVSGSICDACAETVQELEDILEIDYIEEIIEDITGIVCSFVPIKELKQQCNEVTQDVVEEFFYNVKAFLVNYDGKKICELVHLCKADKIFELGFGDVSAGPLCKLCEDNLQLFRQILTDPQLEKMITADLKLACLATGPLKSLCGSYVESFTETLFSQIRGVFEKFDDHNTCVLFDFCADTGNRTTLCDVCSDGFDSVKEFLTSPTVRKLVKEEVDIACVSFGPLKRICIAEANKLIDGLFKVIDVFADVSGQEFCTKVHLCKKPELFLA